MDELSRVIILGLKKKSKTRSLKKWQGTLEPGILCFQTDGLYCTASSMVWFQLRLSVHSNHATSHSAFWSRSLSVFPNLTILPQLEGVDCAKRISNYCHLNVYCRMTELGHYVMWDMAVLLYFMINIHLHWC